MTTKVLEIDDVCDLLSDGSNYKILKDTVELEGGKVKLSYLNNIFYLLVVQSNILVFKFETIEEINKKCKEILDEYLNDKK